MSETPEQIARREIGLVLKNWDAEDARQQLELLKLAEASIPKDVLDYSTASLRASVNQYWRDVRDSQILMREMERRVMQFPTDWLDNPCNRLLWQYIVHFGWHTSKWHLITVSSAINEAIEEVNLELRSRISSLSCYRDPQAQDGDWLQTSMYGCSATGQYGLFIQYVSEYEYLLNRLLSGAPCVEQYDGILPDWLLNLLFGTYQRLQNGFAMARVAFDAFSEGAEARFWNALYNTNLTDARCPIDGFLEGMGFWFIFDVLDASLPGTFLRSARNRIYGESQQLATGWGAGREELGNAFWFAVETLNGTEFPEEVRNSTVCRDGRTFGETVGTFVSLAQAVHSINQLVPTLRNAGQQATRVVGSLADEAVRGFDIVVNGNRVAQTTQGAISVGQALVGQASVSIADIQAIAISVDWEAGALVTRGIISAMSSGPTDSNNQTNSSEQSISVGGSGPGEWQEVSESMSDVSRDYQAQIAGEEHRGMTYVVDGVNFDGYDEGRRVLLDAKAKYSQFLDSDGNWHSWYSGADEFVEQAGRQLSVAGDYPIEWHSMQSDVAEALKALLEDNGKNAITIIHTPKT